MVHSQVGSLVSLDGREHMRVSRSQIGFALFGPYATLPPGNHEVEFELLLESDTGSKPDDVICKLDVASGVGTEILVRQDLQLKQLPRGKSTKIRLAFSIANETQSLEFRIWSLGKADFAVAVERPVVAGSPPDPSKMRLFSRAKGFCDENADTLRNLRNHGAEVVEHTDRAAITLAGISVVARHREDFQLISEVLIHNHYKIVPVRDSIVVDVGMNIGLASAFLAKEAWAKKVYSFEPFQDPFRRSKETFDSNPGLRDKIFARNAGLSDKNERPVVHYSTEGTIAMGIKGASSGPVQQLEILDAGEVFQAICAEAREGGWGVIVKLDCEGSEFPIMKRLAERNLLSQIDAFMIEWHKVWSPDVSLSDLTRPLRANGFLTFDHTVESDLFAGMLFAAKTPITPS